MTWAAPTIALAVLLYATFSKRLEGTPLTAPMVFMATGLLAGSKVFDLVNLDPKHHTVKLLAETTLAVVLFGDAARIDLRALRGEFRLPARLLGIGLPLTIVAGLGAALVLFGSMAWPEALVLAVVLAPTDAALGQAVVTLPSLPSRIRQGLNVESGLNDGICVPVFFAALTVATAEAGVTTDSHAIKLLVEEIGYGALFGGIGGAVTALVLLFGVRHRLMDGSWLQIVPAAGAVLCYTAAAGVGGSGFIAAFIGGMIFGGMRRRVGGEVGYLIEELGALLGAATFVVFGGVLLEPALDNVTWAIAGYAILSLTAVRMVPVALALIGAHARPQTVAFIGWFGPRGLASIVFAILIVENEGRLPHEALVNTTIFITVGLSVLVHGLTAAPLARRYAAWHTANPREEPGPEQGEVPEVRWRFAKP